MKFELTVIERLMKLKLKTILKTFLTAFGWSIAIDNSVDSSLEIGQHVAGFLHRLC